MAQVVSGTEGYGAEAEALARQYESFTFADTHAPLLPLFPPAPSRVLDIGAGTGRDAAGFAALGHHVTAVEPTPELRGRAMALHPSPSITWLDDSLPALARLAGRQFDVVMLTAVWMHLDEAQRVAAMSVVAALVAPRGMLAMSLRHGQVPPGRRMFDVGAAETIALAARHGLDCVLDRRVGDGVLKRPGVTWDRLAFIKPG